MFNTLKSSAYSGDDEAAAVALYKVDHLNWSILTPIPAKLG